MTTQQHPDTAAAIAAIEKTNPQSAWDRAVKTYALELMDELDDRPPTPENLINGAASWSNYSYGGNSLIYNEDICARIATPSQQIKKRGGDLPPNRSETWLDCQARALRQAAELIRRIPRA